MTNMRRISILLMTAFISLSAQVSNANEWSYCASVAYKNLQFFNNIQGSYMYSCEWRKSGGYHSPVTISAVDCNLNVKDSQGRVTNWSVSLDKKCRGLVGGSPRNNIRKY